MDERAKRASLMKEVEPPRRQQTGLGVLVVASAAMFFAVASSAFLLRARMADECCPHRAESAETSSTESAQPSIRPARAESDADCGQAVYRNNPDGSVTVYFDLCSGSGAAGEPVQIAPDSTPVPAELEGVEVREVHPH